MLTVFVFGNPDVPEDSLPLQIVKKLKFPEIHFQIINPNDDLPIVDHPLIFDTVYGLSGPTILTEADLDKLILSPHTTAHDYDLGFQLKYLRKLGKIKTFTIVGVPPEESMEIQKIQQLFLSLI